MVAAPRLRKVLPISVIKFLTPSKGQSRQATHHPALVVWILAFFVFLIVRARAEHPEVLLSEGRRFQIQAVAFGTNHVVGWDDSWLAPSHEPPMIF
jgi:hypothetical protein